MKDFLRHNGRLILVIALLLALLTAVVSFTFGGLADPLSNAAGVIATPFRNGINAFVNWTEGVYSDTFQRQCMEEELERLRKENAQLKKEAREGEADSRENKWLRNLLGLAEKREDMVFETATVTAVGGDNWSSTLTVSKGSAAGVEAGDCVVDVDLEMGGLIARTDGAAILEGDFALMGQGKLKLTYLPEGVQLLAGDAILTSGLMSGGTATYPSGLVVGYVEEVRSDDSGMSDYAVLTPAAQLGSLERVAIIKEFDVVE